ncbi:hypothetical protein Y032_0118g716 [Ancylostoma ceylanicum]|uniref:Uncharacterized protein n=1 Tax=Ancylostoma ceylanicum TaxID=53326 RepID=A0A016TBE6_9BILA|nr:hypothetical protein Y032_0118g716 [Ancylostoma ceylanicum]
MDERSHRASRGFRELRSGIVMRKHNNNAMSMYVRHWILYAFSQRVRHWSISQSGCVSECLHKSNTLSSASIDGFFGRECHGRELERRLATCIGGVLMLAVNLSTTNFELQQPLDFEMG